MLTFTGQVEFGKRIVSNAAKRDGYDIEPSAKVASATHIAQPMLRAGARRRPRQLPWPRKRWGRRRPSLDPGAAFSTEPPPSYRAEPVSDAALRDLVVAACRRADLILTDSQIDMICVAAPHVMAMTRRLRRERDFREEPANIFQFPE